MGEWKDVLWRVGSLAPIWPCISFGTQLLMEPGMPQECVKNELQAVSLLITLLACTGLLLTAGLWSLNHFPNSTGWCTGRSHKFSRPSGKQSRLAASECQQ